jgi:hypothetical protein
MAAFSRWLISASAAILFNLRIRCPRRRVRGLADVHDLLDLGWRLDPDGVDQAVVDVV